MTEDKRTIRVDYLARVEGEGALTIRYEQQRPTAVELRIFEPPRFFEAFLRGRSQMETPDITSRICGICPVAYITSACEAIEFAHGGGGRRMRQLIEDMFLPAFASDELLERHDSAVFELGGGRIAFTTDSFVVDPLFFPGGDIGKLAVCGTVNDLAMAGARMGYLSVGLIIEEGFPMADLARVIASMKDTAAAAGIRVVTGDTKVVDRGKGDKLFINTAGVGLVPEGVRIGPRQVREGDAIIVSGDIGRHGVAILSVREGLGFESPIASDCAPLNGLVDRLIGTGIPVHCLRDLTRGGLASALNEIATDGGVGISLQEDAVPVHEAVGGACELLGLDPLYVANEGRMVAFVPAAGADEALAALQGYPLGEQAAVIGQATGDHPGSVVLHGRLGGKRLLDLLSGEQLPRIC